MSSRKISVESEVFSVDEMPAGESIESAAEQDEHIDLEFQASPEAAVEAGEESIDLEAISQWRVGKCLLALRKQVDEIAPRRNKASDGTIGDRRHCGSSGSTSDHCPRVGDGGIGVVTAMDITHDPSGGCDADAIAESIRDAKDPRVKYIIWRQRICSSYPVGGKSPWTWRNYSGANPHNKHVHVSVKGDKPSYETHRKPGTCPDFGQSPE